MKWPERGAGGEWIGHALSLPAPPWSSSDTSSSSVDGLLCRSIANRWLVRGMWASGGRSSWMWSAKRGVV